MMRLPEKMRTFCRHQKLLRLAFLDPDGYPRVVPLWFVMRGGEFYFGTDRESPKGRFIRHNPKVGWVVDGGMSARTYKGVSFWGTAAEVTDDRLWKTIWRALGRKYYGSPHDRHFQQLYTPETMIVRLMPERFFFGDHTG